MVDDGLPYRTACARDSRMECLAFFAQVEVLRDKRLEQIQQLCIGDAALEKLGKCPDVAVLHVDADVAESRLLLRVEQKISRNYVKSHNASSSPPLNGGQRRRS